ncbi:MAG: hypothetical protein ABIB47_05365 [Candidatus Woesearchaeota archaeon]
MFIWILNILDLIVAFVLSTTHFGFFPSLIIPTIIYLIIKGVMFIKDPFSIIDLIIAVYLVVLAFGINTFITWIFVLYLIYKTIISFQV